MDIEAYVGSTADAPLHTLVRVMCIDDDASTVPRSVCHCGKEHLTQFVFVTVISTGEILRLGRKCLAKSSDMLKSNMNDLEKGLKKLTGVVNSSAPDGDVDAKMSATLTSIAADNGFITKDVKQMYMDFVRVSRKRVGQALLDFFRMTRKRVLFGFDNYRPQLCDGCESYTAATVTANTATLCCGGCGKRRALPPPPQQPFIQRTRKCLCGAVVFVQLSKEGVIHYGCTRCGKFAPDPDFTGQDKECDYCVDVMIKGRRSNTQDHRPYWLCDICGQFTN